MSIPRTKPLKLGPFVPGVNNRRPETKMRGTREDGGDFLRFAVNTDISAEGTLKRRQGYTLALGGTDCHSLWISGTDAFMVDGQNLLRLTGLGGDVSSTVLRTDLAPGRPVCFTRAPDAVYYSNGQVIGRITPGQLLGVNTPALLISPSVAASAGGSLPVGRYGLAFTHVDAVGRESGSTAPIYVETTETSRTISITGLPTSFPTGVAATVVYMTGVNDSMLMRAMFVPAPIGSTTIAAQLPEGARLSTLLLRDLPPGDILRFDRGRLLSASGSMLYYSEPFMPGLMNPSRGYIPLPAPITMVASVVDGVYVCADKTYWLGGDIATASLEAKLPYGAIPGSYGEVPNTNDVFWMSPRGIVTASPGGELSNRQEKNVAVAPASYAAGFFRESDGRKQLGQSMFGAGVNRMAAASYMNAEVIRKKEAP